MKFLLSSLSSALGLSLARSLALSLTVASIAIAPLVAHADTTTDALKSTLQKQLGDRAKVSDVRRTPITGLYEVTVGNQIIYSDSAAHYVIVGSMRDTATGEDLTQARLDQINKIDFAALPFKDAVKVVRGNGKRKIAVFSDPNCPYCHRLEETLQKVDNVTVYTFIYPILSQDSVTKSKQIWCSKDSGKAWEDWMLLRTPPSSDGSCDVSALKRNMARGQQMNVTGTPTVFLVNGNRLPGAVSADELEKAIVEAN